MEPFYFGKSPKSLFGNYHPPQNTRIHDVGIILCYPMGQEYIRSHRAFLKLANLLSSNGFYVLRFDFYGCGDSEGNCNDGNINQWLIDISTAVDELKNGCEVSHICLVGLRLGATLSLIAGLEIDDVRSMVLWDPVINGKEYLKELTIMHQEWLEGSFAKVQLKPKHKKYDEILGFPVTDSLIEELESVDLISFQQKLINNVFLIENSKMTNSTLLKEYLDSICIYLHYKYIPSPKVWIKKDNENDKGLVPIKVLQSIVSWISEVYS